MKYILELKIFCCFFNLKNVLNFLTFWILLFIIDMLCFIINFLVIMENYELASKDIKQIDWVTSQVKNWLSNIKENVNQNGPEQTSSETSAETSIETPAETPTETPAEIPTETSTETSIETPAETPAETPTETPTETSTETPTETSTESSTETSTETPTETSTESSTETPTETSTESGELFYEIDNEKVILKMDIVKSYLEKIKDKERNDLKASNAAAWIMAVQIAIRSPQVWWGNKDKYWDIVIDGILWPKTKEAVEKFQTEYKLKVDGLPGKETMNKIYDILTWNVQAWTWEKNESEWDDSNTNSWSEASWSDSNEEVNKETWDNSDIKESSEKEPKDTEIVPLKNYISDIKYDLKYATNDNSFKTKIYPDWESNLKLRYDAVQKLMKAQETLKSQWYELKILDAYRPKDAQQKLYDNYRWPSSTKGSNVAYPWTSHHGTWKAVDLTMVDSNWNEVEMPTWFDDFSWKATWSSINKLGSNNVKRKNAYILRKAMEQAWFYTISSEWRHYQIDKWKSTLSHV